MKKIVLVVLTSLLLGGCGAIRANMTPTPEHYLLPSIQQAEKETEVFTVVGTILDPEMEIGDSLRGGFSWRSLVSGGKLEELSYSYTFSLPPDLEIGCRKPGITILPGGREKYEGAGFITLDHDGFVAYNLRGELHAVETQWRMIKPEKDLPKEFLLRLDYNQPNIKELHKGDSELQGLLELSAAYRVVEILHDNKHFTSNLTPEQLEKLIKEDAVIQTLLHWSLDHLYLFVTYPFVGVAQTAISAGITKLFEIPGAFAKRTDKEGFGGYTLNARAGGKMVWQFERQYGACFDELRKLKQ